jgi:hypothetical protein
MIVDRKQGENILLGFVILVVVIGLIIVIHHETTNSQSISTHVESPHGAHFIPWSDMGLPSQYGPIAAFYFFPLTHKQIHQVSTTAKQALAIADGAHGIQKGDGVTSVVAEGSWAGVSLLGYGKVPDAADGIPAYIVVLKGADIKDPYSPKKIYDLCVVIVQASGGTIQETYYISANVN